MPRTLLPRDAPVQRAPGGWAGRLPYAVAAALVAVELLFILLLNGGRFTYTLDDPYIHLALSQHLFRLHYGINAGEPSSPSSSIAFPFLLAPAAPLGVHEYVPLVLNLAALFGSIALLAALVARARLDRAGLGPWGAGVLVTVLAIGFNLVGLAFTGMEHSLHVMVTLAAALGVVVFVEEGRVPWWLLPAVVLGPLVRYEGCAVSLAALVVLALGGRWRVALGAGLAALLPLVAFSAMLVALGLPPLPSSVLVKSEVLARASEVELVKAAAAAVRGLLQPSRIGLLLAAAGALMAARLIGVWDLRTRRPDVPAMRNGSPSPSRRAGPGWRGCTLAAAA